MPSTAGLQVPAGAGTASTDHQPGHGLGTSIPRVHQSGIHDSTGLCRDARPPMLSGGSNSQQAGDHDGAGPLTPLNFCIQHMHVHVADARALQLRTSSDTASKLTSRSPTAASLYRQLASSYRFESCLQLVAHSITRCKAIVTDQQMSCQIAAHPIAPQLACGSNAASA